MGVSLCKQCGYRWHHPQKKPNHCPGCKSADWDEEPEPEAEACGLGGGTCDQCGAKFITELLQDKFCPNCGSDKWDSGESAVIPPKSAVRTFECLKCGHHWVSRLSIGKSPKRCPRKECETVKIREVFK